MTPTPKITALCSLALAASLAAGCASNRQVAPSPEQAQAVAEAREQARQDAARAESLREASRQLVASAEAKEAQAKELRREAGLAEREAQRLRVDALRLDAEAAHNDLARASFTDLQDMMNARETEMQADGKRAQANARRGEADHLEEQREARLDLADTLLAEADAEREDAADKLRASESLEMKLASLDLD